MVPVQIHSTLQKHELMLRPHVAMDPELLRIVPEDSQLALRCPSLPSKIHVFSFSIGFMQLFGHGKKE